MNAVVALLLCCLTQAGMPAPLLHTVGQVPDLPPTNQDAQQKPLGYYGPGREEPEPQGLREVLIGYFGPSDPRHPEGGALWLAATQAIQEANREGGYKGLPFRLVPGWSENPWAGGISTVTRMAYIDKVWALIGSIDGASTHLAEQVVAKARLTLINPASTDRTIHGANVPWMFSCVPGDHLLAPLLVRALDGAPFTLLSATDHDSRAFVTELKSALARSRLSPVSHVEFKTATGELAQRVTSQAVILVAGASDSARVVKALRQAGFAGPILGGPSMGRAIFIEEAGAAAEGVLFPLLAQPSDSRFPDYAAAHAYDAARLLVAAIRKAGLNRARIRDAVQELSGWQGVTGVIRWDNLGQNERPAVLGTIKDGRVAPVDSRPSKVLWRGTVPVWDPPWSVPTASAWLPAQGCRHTAL